MNSKILHCLRIGLWNYDIDFWALMFHTIWVCWIYGWDNVATIKIVHDNLVFTCIQTTNNYVWTSGLRPGFFILKLFRFFVMYHPWNCMHMALNYLISMNGAYEHMNSFANFLFQIYFTFSFFHLLELRSQWQYFFSRSACNFSTSSSSYACIFFSFSFVSSAFSFLSTINTYKRCFIISSSHSSEFSSSFISTAIAVFSDSSIRIPQIGISDNFL